MDQAEYKTTILNIKNLYCNEIEDKEKFKEKVQEEFNVNSLSTLDSNWFSKWRIPFKHAKELHTFTVNYVQLQNGVVTA